MSSPHIFIGFDNEVFYPGQFVTGVAVVVVNTPVKINSLEVRWQGTEHVSWTEALQQKTVFERSLFDHRQVLWPVGVSESSLNTSNNHYEGQDEVVDFSIDLNDGVDLTKSDLFRTTNTGQDHLLQPGTYTYHLKWRIPSNLPLVFEDSTSATWFAAEDSVIPKILSGEKSYIRYYATASLSMNKTILTQPSKNQTSLKTSSVPVEKDLTKIISNRAYFKVVEDLPIASLTNQPTIMSSVEKTFLFASNSPLRLIMTITNGGISFIGQAIVIAITIENKSTRVVDNVKLGLDCTTTFKPASAAPGGTLAQSQNGLAQSQTAQGQAQQAKPANLIRKESVMTTLLPGFASIPAGETRLRTVTVTVPSYYPGSIHSGLYIERKYEVYAECVISMGTNLMAKMPVRLMEWSPYLQQHVPQFAPAIYKATNEADINDDGDGLTSSPPTNPIAATASVTQVVDSTPAASPSSSIPFIPTASSSNSTHDDPFPIDAGF